MTPSQLLAILDRLAQENLHGPTTLPRNSRASSYMNSADSKDWNLVQLPSDMDARDPR